MIRHIVAMALVVALVSPAFADSRKMLVLKSEGRADATTRANVDASIIKLAKTTDAQVSPGDISMADAATAVGCTPDTASCRDQILEMLAVDEIVYASVTPKPGGLEVVAYRVARGGVSRDARSLIQKGGTGEKLDGLAPLFFASTTATLPPPTTTEPPPTTTEPLPPVAEPVPTTTAAPAPANVAYPPPMMIDEQPKRRWPLYGAIGGGSLVLISFLLWGKAADLQEEIDVYPTNTSQDFDNVRSLESDADGYAGLGNVLFIGGLVLGGVSAYYLLKDRRKRSATTTAITPMVSPNGAGVMLTIGGLP